MDHLWLVISKLGSALTSASPCLFLPCLRESPSLPVASFSPFLIPLVWPRGVSLGLGSASCPEVMSHSGDGGLHVKEAVCNFGFRRRESSPFYLLRNFLHHASGCSLQSFPFPIPYWSHTGKCIIPCGWMSFMVLSLLSSTPLPLLLFPVCGKQGNSFYSRYFRGEEWNWEGNPEQVSVRLVNHCFTAGKDNCLSRWLTIFCLQYHRSVGLSHRHFPSPVFLFI